MLTIKNKTSKTLKFPIYKPYKINEILFFDIETTGLSAYTSYLYLIGCMYYKDDAWHITQWLLDDPSQEADLLNAFSNKLKPFKCIIHYNGSGFDIPYLNIKYEKHNIPKPFDNIDSFDMYKQVSPYRKLFPFPNLKLQTLEDYLGFTRRDNTSGGDLIDTYSQFIGRLSYEKLAGQVSKTTYANNLKSLFNNNMSMATNKESENTEASIQLAYKLLLHNYDDIVGLLDTSNILRYITLLDQGVQKNNIISVNYEKSKDYLTAKVEVATDFPYPLKWITSPINRYNKRKSHNNNLSKARKTDYLVSLKDNYIITKMPLLTGELKYFFPNYKDYYYLPKEDQAVHKTIAKYVDKKYKTKAKASNCYTYTKGDFVLFPDSTPLKEANIKTFKEDYHSSLEYISSEDLTSSEDTLLSLVNASLNYNIVNKNSVTVM